MGNGVRNVYIYGRVEKPPINRIEELIPKAEITVLGTLSMNWQNN